MNNIGHLPSLNFLLKGTFRHKYNIVSRNILVAPCSSISATKRTFLLNMPFNGKRPSEREDDRTGNIRYHWCEAKRFFFISEML